MTTLIFVSGEEEFLIERAAEDEARSSLINEIIRFSFPDEEQEYLCESQTPLLSGGTRAFIVRGCNTVPILPCGEQDTLVMIFGKKVPQDSRVKRHVNFPKFKSYQDNNEVVKWIIKEGEFFNIDLSRVAGALFVNSGNCLRKLSTEIEKMTLSVSPGTVVSPDLARQLMCFSASITPKEIIDSICDGQTVKALSFYDRLQERADETGWIIAYMQRHILQQFRFEVLLDQKTQDDRAASILGIHPFIYRKMKISRKGLWTKKSLMESMNTLCSLDVANKRGDIHARFGTELEIIRLAEEARDVKRH